jgi:hypothetical protein
MLKMKAALVISTFNTVPTNIYHLQQQNVLRQQAVVKVYKEIHGLFMLSAHTPTYKKAPCWLSVRLLIQYGHN